MFLSLLYFYTIGLVMWVLLPDADKD